MKRLRAPNMFGKDWKELGVNRTQEETEKTYMRFDVAHDRAEWRQGAKHSVLETTW